MNIIYWQSDDGRVINAAVETSTASSRRLFDVPGLASHIDATATGEENDLRREDLDKRLSGSDYAAYQIR